MLLLSKHPRISKGLSLIEASMVLALSAIVVSGVLYYYNNASSNRKLEEDSKTIQMVISTIRTLYENQRQDIPIDLKAVALSGNFKTNNGSEGMYIKMPTGEQLMIRDGTNHHKRRMYAIDFVTSDKSICSHLASIKYGTSHFATEVGNAGSNGVSNVDTLLNKPLNQRYLTVDQAATQCSQKIDQNSSARVYMAFKG